MAFRGTYLRRLRAFLDESDSAVVLQLHRRLAQELAACVAKSTDSPASGHPRSPASNRPVSRPRRPRRLKRVASSAGGPESSGRLTVEMSSVQALMDLALLRFTMAEGPRQVHPPWSVTSESPASLAPSQIKPRGGEDSRCSMDQTSISSVYLNLDAPSSSSDEESLDVKKCEDFAVTIVCSSEESGTRVNSEEVLSDEDFPAVFAARDIRQVVRQRANPPGGHRGLLLRGYCRQVPWLIQWQLSESPDLLPSFGLSSSSPSTTLPWGTAEDSSPTFSPNRVRDGHSQDIPDEGSLFNVSPLSPGLVVRPTRGSGAAPSEGVYCQRC